MSTSDPAIVADSVRGALPARQAIEREHRHMWAPVVALSALVASAVLALEVRPARTISG